MAEAALNSLGRMLGWSQIDSLESFQWMPYEDGTLIPIAGEWLRGQVLSTFNEIPVLFPPDETETCTARRRMEFRCGALRPLSAMAARRLGRKRYNFARSFHRNLSRFSPRRWHPCFMKLPVGVSWFEVRDALACTSRSSLCRLRGSEVEGLPMKRLSVSGEHWPPK